MLHDKLVKITINVPNLAEVIIDMIVRYHGVPKSIIMDQDLLFILKFLFLICYFLEIKKKLFTAFYPQIDSQTER